MEERGDFELTVAATDGSWVRQAEGRYLAASFQQEGGLLALGRAEGGLEFWNGAGETVALFPAQAFEPYLGTSVHWSREGGPWVAWYHKGLVYVESYNYLGTDGENSLQLYLDLATGEILGTPPEGYPAEPDYGEWVEEPQFPGYQNVWSNTDRVTGQVYYEGRRDDGSGSDLLDENGNVVWPDYDSSDSDAITDGMLPVWTGRWDHGGSARTSVYAWYDLATGECVFRYPLTSNTD